MIVVYCCSAGCVTGGSCVRVALVSIRVTAALVLLDVKMQWLTCYHN